MSFLYEKQLIQIINIYAPTNPSIRNKFFRNLKTYTKNQNNPILAGDFNMIEDPLLDRKGGNSSFSLIGIKYLQQIKQNNNLVETWCQKNPNPLQFPYHNHNNKIDTPIRFQTMMLFLSQYK